MNFLRFAQPLPEPRVTGRQRFPRIIGLTGLVLVAAALQACSAVKLAYNNAPELAYWYFDGYADFNSVQSLHVKEELAGLQAWHRQTQLPGYIDSLQKIRQKMPGELDAAQACEVFGDARRKMIAVTDHAEPAVAALAVTLSPAQLVNMERKFEKGNTRYREDYLEATPKESRNKRYKEAVNRAEMLYGRLDQKQLERIGYAIDQSGFNARLSYEERLRRQKDVIQTVRSIATGETPNPGATEKARAVVRGLLERSFNSPSAAYRDYLDKLTQGGCRSFADLHNSTTAAQRSKAMETIGGYERDLKALVSKSQAS